jgi:hypothetical protein
MAGEPNPFQDPDVSQYCDEQVERINALEVVLRAALSFVHNRHTDPNDGHAVMVIAAMRGALRKPRD